MLAPQLGSSIFSLTSDACGSEHPVVGLANFIADAYCCLYRFLLWDVLSGECVL